MTFTQLQQLVAGKPQTGIPKHKYTCPNCCDPLTNNTIRNKRATLAQCKNGHLYRITPYD